MLRTKSDLRGKVAVFAEEHYEDRDASGKWKNLLKNYRIEEKCHDLVNELDQTCTDHLKEISRQIASELSFSNHILKDKSLNMGSIINWKKGWNWGTVIVSGGLGIASAITGYDGMQYHIKEIARIPGQAVIITIPDGDRFPDDSKKKMQDLMREEISFVYETENKWLLLSRIIGKHIDRRNIRIEDKIGVAHIPIKKDDLKLLRRVRLAQQLTELLITQ